MVNSQEKVFIDANTLLSESFRLARKIWDDGYHPDFLVTLWRGGTPVGCAIHEFFKYMGQDPFHTTIITRSYIDFKQTGTVEVRGMEHIIEIVSNKDKLLFIDDVFDTGLTFKEVLGTLKEKVGDNAPEVRIATVFYKPGKNETGISPDYYLIEDDRWIVFPHELEGISSEELDKKGREIAEIVRD